MEAELSVAIQFKDAQVLEFVTSHFMLDELPLDVSPALSELMKYLEEVEFPEIVDVDEEALIICGEWLLGGGNWFVDVKALLISFQKIGGASASAILTIDGEQSGIFYYADNGNIEFDESYSAYEDEELFESDECDDGYRFLAKEYLLSLANR